MSADSHQYHRVHGPQFEPPEHSHPQVWRTDAEGCEHADVRRPQILHPASIEKKQKIKDIRSNNKNDYCSI